jgi:hypothetical protein
METSVVSIAADEDAKSAGVLATSTSVLQWLSSCEDNWLMIFDGANGDSEVVEAFIPPGKYGNILISSCNATMNRLASSSSAYMEVVELDEDAAVELFVKAAELGHLSPTERGHVEEIVRELCCLAYALQHAASLIATGICRIDEYLDMYKQHHIQLMNKATPKDISNYAHIVYLPWEVPLLRLEASASASSSDSASYKTAILILRLLSFYPLDDGLCEETFRRAADTKGLYLGPLQPDSQFLPFLQQTEDHEWDLCTFRAGIRILSQYSFIKTDENFTRAYGMHRLVRRWIQDRLPKFARSEMALLDTIVHGLPLAGGNPNEVEDVGAEAQPLSDSFDNDEDVSSGFRPTPLGTQTESSAEEQPTTPDVPPTITPSREAENAAEGGPTQRVPSTLLFE